MSRVICILDGGPAYRITDEVGREWSFESHPYFGPAVLGKRGDPLAAQPSARSPFWRAVSLWERQGRRVSDGGVAVWDEPPPLRVRRLDGRNLLLLPNQDPACDEEFSRMVVVE